MNKAKAKFIVKNLIKACNDVEVTDKEYCAIRTTIDVLLVAYELPEELLFSK